MAEERPIRTTRTERAPAKRELTGDEIDRLDEGWSSVINSVITVDVEGAHSDLERRLALGNPQSGTELVDAINTVERSAFLASKLKNRARREYEMYKVAHEAWLEPKKAVALEQLEQEKKEKELKKQITEGMVLDKVRGSWPAEVRDRERRLRDFQAAVHTLEDLAEIWKRRSYSLANLKELVLTINPRTVRGKED